DGGADDAERDLFDARHRGVEHRVRRQHAREADQGRGIAGEHEHVRSRRAVEQRNENAERHPKYDRKRRQLGRVDKIGDDGDHGGGADERADGAIESLGPHGAGQRLAGQIDSGHGPARTLQVEAESHEHREDGRHVAIDGEYDRPNADTPDHIVSTSSRRRLSSLTPISRGCEVQCRTAPYWSSRLRRLLASWKLAYCLRRGGIRRNHWSPARPSGDTRPTKTDSARHQAPRRKREAGMHDIVIRGGTIVDGTGKAAFSGDVAIADGKIAAVGGKQGPGRREIDAAGLMVTPGWVDVHTHYDGQAMWDPLLAPSCWHGVTTVLFGNCGVGFAPVKKHHRQALMDLMEGVEEI